MRIAHITSAHPRDDVRIFLKECVSLSSGGHQVMLVVADGLGDEDRSGITICDAGSSTGRVSRMIKAPWRVFKKAILADADVYHLHDPELLPLCPLLKRRGKLVIFDAHEDVTKQILAKHYLPRQLRGPISSSYSIFERFMCRYVDGIIAATPTIRGKFEAFHPSVVDVNNFPLLGEWVSIERDEIPANGVCYIGSIAATRGIREIIQALDLTQSNARLRLAGGFAEPVTELAVRAASGWSKVEYSGVLDREGIKRLLVGSIAGLVTLHPTPSYLDSLPIKMFEYMGAGIPVIASDFPLWRRIVQENQCGVCVNPYDPAAIASAIDGFILDPERARSIGANGQRAVLERYNWAIEEQKLLDFYDQLRRAVD